MRHLYAGRKLKRTHSHRKALLSNLATALLEHKRVQTTEAKAKELRPFVEQLISKAKTALVRERDGKLPNGQTIDVHSRRVVGRILRNKAVLQELFDTIAPVVESRPGGYTRIIKLGQRRGDGSRIATIELVDFFTERDGNVSANKNARKRRVSRSQQPQPKTLQDKLEESIATAATTLEEHQMEAENTETAVAEHQENIASEEHGSAQASEANASDHPHDAPDNSASADDTENNNQ